MNDKRRRMAVKSWPLWLLLVGSVFLQVSGQHWSFGLSPGGKRDLDSISDTLNNMVEGFPHMGAPRPLLGCVDESPFAKIYRIKGLLNSVTDRESGHRIYKKLQAKITEENLNDRAPALQQGGLQLLLEIVVEEAVDDGVDAGGGHGREVAEREDDVVVAKRDRVVIPVKDGVEDIQREPREGHCHHDGDQHDVDPGGALVLLLSGVPATLHHILPPPEAQVDVQVANGDEGQGEEVLEDQQGGGVSPPKLYGRPHLHTNKVVTDGDTQVLERQDDSNRHIGVPYQRFPSGRVDNELVSLHGNEDQRKHGNANRYALDEGRELTQSFSKDPAVHECVDDSHWQAYDAHQNVRAGQVGDEDVGDIVHLLVPRDDEHQAGVPHQAHRHHRAVRNYQESGPTDGERAVLSGVPLRTARLVVIGAVLQFHGNFRGAGE
ncbi:unnamed protein product [Menidia menidia]|uniref:(Atlantic silverside) hypothetical protein n=1 Tax=Menidia menidia TaxID=238744 RepID=A0A8S4B029_9TELE|nr:unnamed protein product [Menidia menidia]